MLYQAATLKAEMSIGEAARRLANFPDTAFVVVRRREGEQTYWYHYRVADLRDFASRAEANWPQGQLTRLTDVLNLHESTSEPTLQLSAGSAGAAVQQRGILLDGDTVIGVLKPAPVAGASRGGGAGATRGGEAPSTGGRPGLVEREFTLQPGPDFTAASATARFEAFPRLDAPAGVVFARRFELRVGLLRQRQDASHEPIVIPDAPLENFDLLVQVIAPGFQTPAGTQRLLHVVRDNPEANEVAFELLASDDEPDAPRQHTLEIQFSFNGNVCGRAWREITVLPTATPDIAVPDAASGSSPLAAPGATAAPDLTISITEADEDGRFIWLFTSPHQVELHQAQQIEIRLDDDNARSFAAKVLKGIPGKDGTGQVGMHMSGTAREIAAAIPSEFWLVLGEIWALLQPQNKLPRLLFLSAEPYVPWELASVEADYIDGALIDPACPLILNAQTRCGRWLPPRPRTPRGGEKPAQPPATTVEVNQMAVITGDYLAMNGIRPLPEAEEEGKLLTGRYRAVRLQATWEELEPLLQNAVERDGHKVDIELIHFACHGQVDMANPANNGIVLSEDNMRLDPTTARGNTIGAATAPFAFFNACEVGTAGETLGSYGGLAAAFLNEGFRGFVAPLWAVNDAIAHQIAVDFYARTLDGKQPVAEALRALRGSYDPTAAKPSATPLAYIFYGHPDLILDWH